MSKDLIDIILDKIFDENWTGRRGEKLTEREWKEEKKQESSVQAEKQELICQRCGSALVFRTAKKGENAGNQFYGCSNFPKCRYIQNL